MVLASHRSPRPPSAPLPIRPSFAPSFALGAPALAPAGMPAGIAVRASRPARSAPTRSPGASPTQHRAAGPTGVRRGRLAAAAVAAGAMATAGTSIADLGQADAPTTELASLSLSSGAAPARSSAGDGLDAVTSGVMPAATPAATRAAAPPAGQAQSLAKASKRAARPAPAAAPSASFVKPTDGTLTSGFGPRWGAEHKGLDIANKIGTPIVAATDGVVTAAGPASGFGLWVKIRMSDGNEAIYGHINRFFVTTGQKIKAGDRIAEVGNRGQSTGPHLHFEVRTPGGKALNPQSWLAERGVTASSLKD